MYEKWIRDQPELLASLSELKGRTLGCWCSPKPCHGDVLVKLVEEFGSEGTKDGYEEKEGHDEEEGHKEGSPVESEEACSQEIRRRQLFIGEADEFGALFKRVIECPPIPEGA